jgi:N-terminal acetyltransferase B complex non-catalytic subunit
MVYISILEQQAKYGDALDILSGKLGSLLLVEVDKLRIQVLSEAFIFNVKW